MSAKKHRESHVTNMQKEVEQARKSKKKKEEKPRPRVSEQEIVPVQSGKVRVNLTGKTKLSTWRGPNRSQKKKVGGTRVNT